MSEAGSKRPTLKDLAKAAGVSLTSASYAINGNGSLGEQTREHVQRIAREIGYRQNLGARAMRTGRTGALGLVLPDLGNPFFPGLAQAVIQAARQRGYSVYVTDTEGSETLERTMLQELADRGVDGIVWFPVRDVDSGALDRSVPTVVLDRSLPDLDCVQADYSLGGRRAAEHLIAMGHRRIGVISGPVDIASMRDRCDAAVRHIVEHGELAFHVVNAFSTDLEAEVLAALEQGSADAVFVGSDLIAMGVLRHLQERGVAVPGQMSVIGFDDIPWACFCSPPLSTIEMPLEQMAAEAMEVLMQRVAGVQSAPRRVVLDAPLIARASVRDARKS